MAVLPEGMSMMCVKHGKFILTSLLLTLSVALAFAQEPVMILNHEQTGFRERPPVKFDHERHAGKLDCTRCHHDYDEYGNNHGGEDRAQSCTNCHVGSVKEGVLPLMEAFHAQCKQCHEKTRGPVMCGECHDRRNNRLTDKKR